MIHINSSCIVISVVSSANSQNVHKLHRTISGLDKKHIASGKYIDYKKPGERISIFTQTFKYLWRRNLI